MTETDKKMGLGDVYHPPEHTLPVDTATERGFTSLNADVKAKKTIRVDSCEFHGKYECFSDLRNFCLTISMYLHSVKANAKKDFSLNIAISHY